MFSPRFARTGLAAIVLLVALAASSLAQDPVITKGAFGNPEFDAKGGRYGGGSIALVRHGLTGKFLLSVKHLIGSNDRGEGGPKPEEMPDFIRSVTLKAFTGGTAKYSVKGLTTPFDAAKRGAVGNDFIILQVTSNVPDEVCAPLAKEMPKVGEPAWVIAKVRGGTPEGQYIQPGKVVDAPDSEGWLKVQFDNDSIVTTGASGAAVINAAGEVIGTYWGHGKRDGKVIAFVVPCTFIKPLLEAAAP